jgi:four helix bundle protein
MKPETRALRERTHSFFVRVITLCNALSETPACRTIGEQLLRSSGGADSNYRAACKARSKKEFIAKIGVAAEEADESQGWLEALKDAGLVDASAATPLINEADELTSIFVASGRTAAQNLANEQLTANLTRRARSR